MKIRNAEILCVGTEILIGDIVNTNAAYISKGLAQLGINQHYQAVIGDNAKRLEQCITSALERCDLLIMTGGLGPTYDDITKETAAKCMGRKMYLDEESLHRIKDFFACKNSDMPCNNEKQAYMPEGALIFKNDYGTAPGLAIKDEERGKIIILLPGPPREMIPMFDNEVVPYLAGFSENIFVSKNINILGIGESKAEDLLRPLMLESLNPTVAPYCKEGEVRLRVTARAESRGDGERMCDRMIEKIKSSPVGEYIYGIDTDPETALCRILAEKGLTVSCAESCTGGMLSKRITDVPGSSAVFPGGAVSYSNSVKENLLGVSHSTLERFGAVSGQCAEEMACGVRRLTCSDYGVSTTGIAGPGGGTEEKPVGLVYIGIASPDGVKSYELRLSGDRSHIRHITCNNVFRLLMEELRKIK